MSSTQGGIETGEDAISAAISLQRECERAFAESEEALERLGSGADGEEGETDFSRSPDKERAADIIRSIGKDFVRLRKQGRSEAWAELEDRLMTNAHVLISAGMLSPKDWISISISIEDFRKQAAGTQTLPADFIANWLAEPSQIEPEEIKRPEPLPKVKKKLGRPPRTGKKAETVNG